MSRLEDLWDVLRRAGVESVAPILIRHGVTSVNQVVVNAEVLLGAGVSQWQLEAILASCPTTAGSLGPSADSVREDLPVRCFNKRANLQAALEAAQPNQRQKSLRLLDQDVLARSTNPAYEARIRTYMTIARAWEVPAFPLNSSNIRCFAASLKAGGYRSAAVYFQAICSYQQRNLRTHVPQMVRATIRDCLRSISRGLGTSKLKDSFDALLLGRIEAVEDNEPFSFSLLHHIRDMSVLGIWYMMRESELAGARAGDLSLESNQAQPPHVLDLMAKNLNASRGTSARPKAFASAVRSLKAEMEQIKGALSAPSETFVFRPKARILHRASKYEANNEPAKWRTPCGWNYGSRTFLRTADQGDGTRKCKKCFDLSDRSSSESDDSSSEISELEVTSASSADEAD
eukprot:s2661_g12.t1